MITKEQAEAFVLLKLLDGKYVGGKHTHERNIPKGVPPEDIPIVTSALNDLRKKGWIIRKPTNNGEHVSLNPRVCGDAYRRLRQLGEVI